MKKVNSLQLTADSQKQTESQKRERVAFARSDCDGAGGKVAESTDIQLQLNMPELCYKRMTFGASGGSKPFPTLAHLKQTA